MKNFTKGVALSLFFVATLASCSDDNDDNNNTVTPTPNPSYPTPEPADADGACWAIRTISTQQTPIGPIEVELEVAVAVFFTNTGVSSSLSNVGVVSADGTDLTRQSNNSYIYTPSPLNPTGLQFGSDVGWEVTGGAAFSAFTYTDNQNWPDISNMLAADTLYKSDDYSISLSGVTNCDSVLFSINDQVKFISGNASSATFSSAELSTLSTGVNYLNVAGVKLESNDQGGKNIYFGKEYVLGKTVYVMN